MARFLILGIIILPLVEIALFIKVGQTIGLLPTLGLIVGAALLGTVLLRQQGLSVVNRMRGELSARRLPGRAILDAALIGIAALLLVLPGFLSDIAALLLLLPPVRTALYALLARHVTVVATGAGGPAYDPYAERRVRGPSTIDLDDDDYRPR